MEVPLKEDLGTSMGVSKNNGITKSSILIGFSIIFTIHFGGNTPHFWKLPYQLISHFLDMGNPDKTKSILGLTCQFAF